eukprot:jgi/Mesvir1/11797/Mv00158-RA.1
MQKARRSPSAGAVVSLRVFLPAAWLTVVILLSSGLTGGYAAPARRKHTAPSFSSSLARHHVRHSSPPARQSAPAQRPSRPRQRPIPESPVPAPYSALHGPLPDIASLRDLPGANDIPAVNDHTLPGPPTPGYNPKQHFDASNTWWGRLDNQVDPAELTGILGLGQACNSRRECMTPLLCTNGACGCPLIPSITAFNAPGCRKSADQADITRGWCLRPLSSLPSLKQKRHARVLHPRYAHDLIQLADFSTCAVVGSAAEIATGGASFGLEIDSHTAVIRFNEAPTKGFEPYVGSRTTLRIQNVDHCGFHESPDEILVHYTPKPVCSNASLDLNPDFYRYVEGNFLWRLTSAEARAVGAPGAMRADPLRVPGPNGTLVEEPPRKMSGGFFGVALAGHICGRVDMYGFSESSAHYYEKKYVDKPGHTHKGFADRHNWGVERACLQLVHEGLLPGMTFHQ